MGGTDENGRSRNVRSFSNSLSDLGYVLFHDQKRVQPDKGDRFFPIVKDDGTCFAGIVKGLVIRLSVSSRTFHSDVRRDVDFGESGLDRSSVRDLEFGEERENQYGY